MSIVAEIPGYLQVLSAGSIKRLQQQISPPSSDSSSKRYKSKDVIINSKNPIPARIFLPDVLVSSSLLPVLVYFHGGGFCVGSTTWLGYHTFLGDLAVAPRAIVPSVDYILAPENKLPAAYDDCYSSLEWLSGQGRNESWLERADLCRVFLSGDSAGRNIFHNVVLIIFQEKSCDQVKIKGLLIIHPFFGESGEGQWRRSSGFGIYRHFLEIKLARRSKQGLLWM